MPQTALSNGELLKKTLKTTLVMVGSTAVWLGGISVVAMLATEFSFFFLGVGFSAREGGGAVTGTPAVPRSEHRLASRRESAGGVNATRRPALRRTRRPRAHAGQARCQARRSDLTRHRNDERGAEAERRT